MTEHEHEGERRRNDVQRRTLLKAAAAPFVVGAAGAWFGNEGIAGDRLPTAHGNETVMKSRPLMTLKIAAAPPQKIGAVPRGVRSIVPVTGGEFEGPRLRGKVLSGGSDWLLLRSDDVLELNLRITLETDDHALISMTFLGLRHGPPDVVAALNRSEIVDPGRYYFRTLPSFETSAESYAFLNRVVAVGSGQARPDGAVHRIDEIL